MPAAQMNPAESDVSIELETPADARAVDAIVAASFGPGRFTKTAERLREDSAPLPGLSFVARRDGAVVGTVRLWPARIGATPVAFLGPIAVDPTQRSEGLGALLVEQACAAAEAQGWAAVLLVGDTPYFGRFGFAPTQVELPGPVDPRRILIRKFAAVPELDNPAPEAGLPMVRRGLVEAR
jgi:predicted N-acetyltransferase YhbS